MNSALGPALAALIGGLLGFLALYLREMGLAFATATGIVMALFYVSRNRLGSVGWLLLGIGLVPALILGRNGLQAVLDPSVDVGFDTWVMLGCAALVATVGGLIIWAAAASDRAA